MIVRRSSWLRPPAATAIAAPRKKSRPGRYTVRLVSRLPLTGSAAGFFNHPVRRRLHLTPTILRQRCSASGDGIANPAPLDCRRSRAPARPQRSTGEMTMPTVTPQVTWDHVHLRSPDPEATAQSLHDVLGGEIIRGPGRIDVKLGGAN